MRVEQDHRRPASHTILIGLRCFGTELSARHLVGFRSGTWKAVFDDSRQASVELYDLATDPREQHDLAEAYPIRAGYARQGLAERELAARTHLGHRADTTIADPETERRLRALGYVDDGK